MPFGYWKGLPCLSKRNFLCLLYTPNYPPLSPLLLHSQPLAGPGPPKLGPKQANLLSPYHPHLLQEGCSQSHNLDHISFPLLQNPPPLWGDGPRNRQSPFDLCEDIPKQHATSLPKSDMIHILPTSIEIQRPLSLPVTSSFLSHVFFLISVVRCPYFSFAPSYREIDLYLLAFLDYSSPLLFPL